MLSFGILRIWWLNYHCVATSPPCLHHHHDHALNKSSDDGEYTCWSGSQQSKAAKLTVQAPPGVPHIRFLCWSSRCWSEIHTIIWAEWKWIGWLIDMPCWYRQARNGGSLEATRDVRLQLDCESLVRIMIIDHQHHDLIIGHQRI